MSEGPLFLAPLRTEALALRRGAREVEVERIGMGPVRATSARARLARVPPGRPVVLFGFAGGLSDELRAGDLVVATSCAGLEEDDEPYLLPEAASVAHLLGLAGLSASVHLGPVVSTPRVLKGLEERTKAGRRGALAVDMESLWCASLARVHPFAVVRAVLDVPGHDVLSAATPAATWRAFRSLSAAARALRSWSTIPLDKQLQGR
ncbi:MAG: lytB [Acidimicrobiaceae bacterium]|nr:lytB [Acidimicrobiaceae bacterium]